MQKKRCFFNLENGVRVFCDHESLEHDKDWIEITQEQKEYLEDSKRWKKK